MEFRPSLSGTPVIPQPTGHVEADPLPTSEPPSDEDAVSQNPQTAIADFRRRLLAQVRQAVRDEHSMVRDSLLARWQESERRLDAANRLAVERLFTSHLQKRGSGIENSSRLQELSPVRRRREHRCRTWAPRASSAVASGSSASPARRSIARLPVEAVSMPEPDQSHRSSARPSLAGHSARAIAGSGTRQACGAVTPGTTRSARWRSGAGTPAVASPAHESLGSRCGDASSVERTGSPGPGTPSPRRLSRQNTGRTETESNQRHEEDERWKHQWQNHMRSRLARRLTRRAGSLTRSVSRLLGLKDVPCQQPALHRERVATCWLERLLRSDAFRIYSSVEILVNVMFIGFQADLSMRCALASPEKEAPDWVGIANQALVGALVAEVGLRLIAFRWQYFCCKGWRWNMFDFLLAAYLVADELMESFNLEYARILRSFRIFRVLRVLRGLRFLGDLRMMVCLVLQSLVSLGWAFLLLFLIMFVFSICFMNGAAQYVATGADPDVVHDLKMYYGTLWDTMFSLLMAISGGVNWSVLVQPLAKISAVYKVLFSGYVLFVLVGVLNVLTSVFVQRAHQLSRLDRELVVHSEMASNEAFLAQMKTVFEEADVDETGRITWHKFKEYLQHERVQAYFATHQLDTSDARELFNLLDVSGTGEVKIEDFVLGCSRLRGQARSSDVATLIRENRRAHQKQTRLMRKLDAQLGTVQRALHAPGAESASAEPTPISGSSCLLTPGTSPSGFVTPPHLRTPARCLRDRSWDEPTGV